MTGTATATGTGTGTGVETHRRTPDGNGDGNGDVSEDSSGDGNGDEDNGNRNEDRIGEEQYFGEIKNLFFSKNELFFKDPEDVYSRSARPSASYTYWLCSNERT